MEAALKKLFAIALLAACATAPSVAFAAKRHAAPPPPPEYGSAYGPGYGSAYGPAPGYGPAYGPLIDAPVALPYGGGAYPGFGGCSTDEGYGRRGSCDAPGSN